MTDRKSRTYRAIIDAYDLAPRGQRAAVRRDLWQAVLERRLAAIRRQAEAAVLELMASAREAISSSLSESRKRSSSDRD